MKKLIIVCLALLSSCSPKALPTVKSEKAKIEEKQHNKKRISGAVLALLFIYGCSQLIPNE